MNLKEFFEKTKHLIEDEHLNPNVYIYIYGDDGLSEIADLEFDESSNVILTVD